MQELSDIKRGGMFQLDKKETVEINGEIRELDSSLYVEPNERREFLSVWPNGAAMEVQVHDKAPDDANHPDDNILFRMIDQDGGHVALWINVEDAQAIMFGLERAIKNG